MSFIHTFVNIFHVPVSSRQIYIELNLSLAVMMP